MDSLKGFLSRFAHLKPVEPEVQRVVGESVRVVCGISLPQGIIVYKDGVVFIQCSNTIKKALLEKKIMILEKVQREVVGSVVVRDIR